MQKVLNFINEVRAVAKNISWPKKDTLIQLTVVVISISVVISTLLGGFDYLLTNSFALLANSQNRVDNNLIIEPTAAPDSSVSPATPSAQPTTNTTPSPVNQ